MRHRGHPAASRGRAALRPALLLGLLAVAPALGLAGQHAGHRGNWPVAPQHEAPQREASGRESPGKCAGMSLDQAIASAERKYRARVVKADVQDGGGGRCVYVLRLLSEEGRVWNVRVDSTGGGN